MYSFAANASEQFVCTCDVVSFVCPVDPVDPVDPVGSGREQYYLVRDTEDFQKVINICLYCTHRYICEYKG